MRVAIATAKVKNKRRGRKPLPPVIIKKVIEACEQAPASVARIRKGYQAGIYDRDGFRYEKPLVSV